MVVVVFVDFVVVKGFIVVGVVDHIPVFVAGRRPVSGRGREEGSSG